MKGVKVDMLFQWSCRNGWCVLKIDLDISDGGFFCLFFFQFRYISSVHEGLIVITWVVMLGIFINGHHNGWYGPYKHGMLYQNQARFGAMI